MDADDDNDVDGKLLIALPSFRIQFVWFHSRNTLNIQIDSALFFSLLRRNHFLAVFFIAHFSFNLLISNHPYLKPGECVQNQADLKIMLWPFDFPL